MRWLDQLLRVGSFSQSLTVYVPAILVQRGLGLLRVVLLTYLISIPLGIAKARRDGSRFDVWTSAIIIVGYAIPGFLFSNNIFEKFGFPDGLSLA